MLPFFTLWLACAPVAYYPFRAVCMKRASWTNGDAVFFASFCIITGPIALFLTFVGVASTTIAKLGIWEALSDWMSRPAKW